MTGKMPAPASVLSRECSTFSRYLVKSEPDAYVCQKYAASHAVLGDKISVSAFDVMLVHIARVHPLCTSLADAYSTFFYRRGALRVKLVLLLAILETSPTFQGYFSRRQARSVSAAASHLVIRGLAFALTLLASVLLLAPLHAVLKLTRRSAHPSMRLDRA